ncbi:MAG: FecR family protein [Pseudomonadota bacterium]
MKTTLKLSTLLRTPSMILLCSSLGIANMAWASTAGKAIFVLGEVKAKDATQAERKLGKGDEINTGDTIITSLKGQAHVQMSDGGMIAIRPGSEFRIDEYAYDGKTDSDKSVFSLLKGGFRSITGAIGQANKSAYGVKTPVATIGIRGTDYLARLCAADCGNGTTGDGLYVTVLTGGVAVANSGGSVDIAPGQFGFAASTGATPSLLPSAPSGGLFSAATGVTRVASTTTANTPASNTQSQAINGALDVTRTDSVPLLALPTQGTYSYTLTSPVMNPSSATITTGTSLTADFAAMNINGTINVSSNGDTLSGNTGNLKINSQTATFGGNFSSVAANLSAGVTTSASGTISGNLAGPVIADTAGVPSGAVSFNMTASTSTSTTTVGGSATLQ